MIPTAEEFCKQNHLSSPTNYAVAKIGRKDGKIVYSMKDAMIDFAKLHVEAALKAAAEQADAKASGSSSLRVSRKNLYWTYAGNIGDVEIDKNSILNAYPLENIK